MPNEEQEGQGTGGGREMEARFHPDSPPASQFSRFM